MGRSKLRPVPTVFPLHLPFPPPPNSCPLQDPRSWLGAPVILSNTKHRSGPALASFWSWLHCFCETEMVVTRKAVDVDAHGLGNISSRWPIGPGGSGLGDGTLPRTSPRLPTKRAARLASHLEVTPKAPLGAAGRRACPGKAQETGCCGVPHWSVCPRSTTRIPTAL